MTKNEIIFMITSVLIGVALFCTIAAGLLKLVWAWVMPELFPGAVAQGLLVASLSWGAAFKLTVFMMVLAVFVNRKFVYPALGNNEIHKSSGSH